MAQRAETTKNSDNTSNTASSTTVNKKVQRKQDAERRKKLKPLYDALKKADKALEKHHQQQKDLENKLADTSLYEESNKTRLKQAHSWLRNCFNNAATGKNSAVRNPQS